MSLLSFTIFISFVFLSMASPNIENKITSTKQSTIQNFKEFVTNMIKDQSSKIQTLLKKVQINAQSVLKKIENMKQDSLQREKKKHDLLPFHPFNFVKKDVQNQERQVESPIKNVGGIDMSTEAIAESRSFPSHYGASSYGTSGNGNYGGNHPTYHHHSIGFDPINIVVSVSLLSFLLQALQGLLSRTRLPTQVVEARYLNPVQDWLKKFEEKNTMKGDYLKRKYPKKYFH